MVFRRMQVVVVILSLLVIFSPIAYADDGKADSYVCISDIATGFIHKNSGWEQADFHPNKKYLLKFYEKSLLGAWSEVGYKAGAIECSSLHRTSDYINCGEGVQGVRFNKKSGRYIMSFYGAYVEPGDFHKLDTPFIEIGNCSKI